MQKSPRKRNVTPALHSLELCLARYLSLHFFFFPNGLQEWLPSLALLLLATLLRAKKRSRSSWEHFGLSAAVRRWHGTSRQMWHRGAGGGSLIGHDGARLPFLQLRGGDQPGKVGSAALHSALPPVGILLVDDLDDVTGLELQARLFARDEVILGGVVVELRPHVHLQIKQNVTRLLFGRAKKKKKRARKHLQRLFEQNQWDQYSPTTYRVLAETTLSDIRVLIWLWSKKRQQTYSTVCLRSTINTHMKTC